MQKAQVSIGIEETWEREKTGNTNLRGCHWLLGSELAAVVCDSPGKRPRFNRRSGWPTCGSPSHLPVHQQSMV